MMKAGGKDCKIKCSSARHVAQCEEHPGAKRRGLACAAVLGQLLGQCCVMTE
jgi:hypothetical protein